MNSLNLLSSEDSLEFLLEKAHNEYSKGNVKKAQKLYLDGLKINPQDVEILQHLSATYFTQNNFDLAIKTVDRALKLDPNSIDLILNKGTILFHSDNYSEAIKNLDEVLKVDPFEKDAIQKKSACLVYQGLKLESEDLVETGLDMMQNLVKNTFGTQDSENQILSLAGLYYDVGSYEHAKTFYQKMLRIDPFNLDAQLGNVACFNKLENYENTINSVIYFNDLNQNNLDVFRQRKIKNLRNNSLRLKLEESKARLKLMDFDSSRFLLEEILKNVEIEGEFESEFLFDLYENLAEATYLQGDHRASLFYLEDLLNIGDSATGYAILADIGLQDKIYSVEECVDFIEKSLIVDSMEQSDFPDPRFLAIAGKVYEANGNLEISRKCFAYASDFSPEVNLLSLTRVMGKTKGLERKALSLVSIYRKEVISSDPETYFLAAEILDKKLGRPNLAFPYYLKCFELISDNSDFEFYDKNFFGNNLEEHLKEACSNDVLDKFLIENSQLIKQKLELKEIVMSDHLRDNFHLHWKLLSKGGWIVNFEESNFYSDRDFKNWLLEYDISDTKPN